ncbi:LysR family transcriptional regulator [Pseudobutyrivibrio ruminis]|uniref:LysR family transcriptional regulator n=1 Tax=Pseudobutyrivibrio ruminis TaxID=46206 RepID=UPI0026E9DF9B|nr:LysR family transcriptional regulator [Pseudobutyrivibrio ruminis]
METSIFNEFLILEETNSFSKAAEQLRISQASLSRHIKQLEDEYGMLLFERTTQKMKLTPYGESLVQYARIILEAERSFKREVEKINFQNSNHLVVGCIDYPFYYGITSHLADFKRENPNATLEVMINSTDELVRNLNTGEVDVAFIRNIDNVADKFDSIFYKEDYMHIAVPVKHPLANKKTVSIKEFKTDTFYKRYKKGSYMDSLFSKLASDAGFKPMISASGSSWEDSVINEPNTVTLCNGALAENFRGNVHVKVLDLKEKPEVNIYLATAKNATHSLITDRFFEYVKASLNG